MIKQGGNVFKKTYCSNCFKIITWTSIHDEQDFMGHRTIICPHCGSRENINDEVTLVEEDDPSNIPPEYFNSINYLPEDNGILAINNYANRT